MRYYWVKEIFRVVNCLAMIWITGEFHRNHRVTLMKKKPLARYSTQLGQHHTLWQY